MYEDKLRNRQGRGRDEVSLTLVEAASSSGE
jgi:hypothetical protein